jgi:hypothetical protein
MFMAAPIEYPDFFRIRQRFSREQVVDVPAQVELELSRLRLAEQIKPGQSVAITAGSRGIANIALILQAIVQHMRQLGAEPFLVPAMGSHGGGTVEGQLALLHDYGITQEFCGCPIRASMETVVVCQAAEGFPVHFDRFAHEADHVFICNRVKPHTNFAGDIESGLMKMMLIGLGKHNGAKIYHRAIMNYSFGQIVRSVAREVLSRCGVVGGLAILENAYDQTAQLTAVEPADFETQEKQLLAQVKTWQPKLPFEEADLLILDQIGKNISGSGLDTNLVGRKYNDHEPRDFETPKIKRIFIRGLTPQSHGNATGIGISEFCLSRVVEQMDVEKTRINCLTGGHVTAAMIPIHYPTDREVLGIALPTIGLVEPPNTRVLWIPDTLHVAEVECSRQYYQQAQQRDDLELLTDLRPLSFDSLGMLPAQPDFAAAPSSETTTT